MASRRYLRFLYLTAALALLVLPRGSTSAASVGLQINNPVCVQPNPANGSCFLKALAVTATGSEASFSNLNVFVNDKLRVNMQGFFESSAYLSPDMLGDGLMVTCGRPNASGDPKYGNIYTVYITASMIDGANTWGSAGVRCPYFEGKLYLPGIVR
jgi:hypothetical protein